jgi:hypothetical protein
MAPTPARSTKQAGGDLNHDGKPDLGRRDVVSADVSVLLGKGDGSFQTASPSAPVLPISVAAGDLNLTGSLILAVAFNKWPRWEGLTARKR